MLDTCLAARVPASLLLALDALTSLWHAVVVLVLVGVLARGVSVPLLLVVGSQLMGLGVIRHVDVGGLLGNQRLLDTLD